MHQQSPGGRRLKWELVHHGSAARYFTSEACRSLGLRLLSSCGRGSQLACLYSPAAFLVLWLFLVLCREAKYLLNVDIPSVFRSITDGKDKMGSLVTADLVKLRGLLHGNCVNSVRHLSAQMNCALPYCCFNEHLFLLFRR